MTKLLYSSEEGDLRKKKSKNSEEAVLESELFLHLRRLTSGKGRTVLEISELPSNKKWCKDFAKAIKKKLGVGGSYKNDKIEIHGEKFDELRKNIQIHWAD